MRKTWAAALSALAASSTFLLATDRAIAADLAGSATPRLTPVQWSTLAQPTFAQYDVQINNPGQATINGWRFVARTSVTGGTTQATFYPAGSDTRCSPGSVASEVVCDFTTIAPGQTVGFAVAFNAPGDGSAINLTWRAFWDESGNGGNDGFKAAQSTALVEPDDSSIASVVPSNSPVLTFFTGSGVATAGDPWSTIVRVPANVSFSTTAAVSETVDPVTCAADLLTCNRSTLTIPGSFSTAPLQITLRRDASTIAKGAKIDSARVYYRHIETASDFEVPSCADPSYVPALPQPGVPCEDRTMRKAYPKKSTPKSPVASGFEGDWEFVIYAIDNGRYTN